jgi:hypothetical protein
LNKGEHVSLPLSGQGSRPDSLINEAAGLAWRPNLIETWKFAWLTAKKKVSKKELQYRLQFDQR